MNFKTNQANSQQGRSIDLVRDPRGMKTDSGTDKPVAIFKVTWKSSKGSKSNSYNFVYRSEEATKISENLRANGAINKKDTSGSR